MDKLEEVVGYRFDLTHIILNKKDLDKNTLNEVKTKLLLVKSLSEKLKNTNDLDCSKEIKEVQECVARIR